MNKAGLHPGMYWFYLLDKQRVSLFLSSLWHSGEQSPALAPQSGDLRGETESRHDNTDAFMQPGKFV